MPSYWLMKSEPSTYSIDDLARDKTTLWDGVRNYQARNFMMQKMETKDPVLFYHSSTSCPAVMGLAEVCKEAQPDPTQFDKKSPYYFAKSTSEKPVWFCVKVKFKQKFPQPVTLKEIKNHKNLTQMLLVQKGQRLSIQPLTFQEFKIIVSLATRK